MKAIILGSSSPYRKALLERIIPNFQCHSPNIDETRLNDESAKALCTRLSLNKANAIAADYSNHLIIGSDQTASVGDTILGKPLNHANALEQLTLCSGKTLHFFTGVCVLDSQTGNYFEAVDETIVHFKHLNHEELDVYLHKEKPYDCAGSFKVEGLGISLFEKIESNDPTGLQGLPLIAVIKLLKLHEVNLLSI